MLNTHGYKDPPAINAPGVILVSLAVLVCVHIYRQLLSGNEDLELLLVFAFIPARYVASDASLGAFPGGFPAEIWTFFSHALIHGDWMHLLLNGIFMLAFGSAVARRLSPTGFLIFSFVCVLGGAVTQLIVNWGEMIIMIGASAAVSGQFAAAIRLLYGHEQGGSLFPATPVERGPAPLANVLRDQNALIILAVWAGMNYLSGTGAIDLSARSSGVAWEAHVGGFVAGLLLFGIFDRIWGPRLRSSSGPYIS